LAAFPPLTDLQTITFSKEIQPLISPKPRLLYPCSASSTHHNFRLYGLRTRNTNTCLQPVGGLACILEGGSRSRPSHLQCYRRPGRNACVISVALLGSPSGSLSWHLSPRISNSAMSDYKASYRTPQSPPQAQSMRHVGVASSLISSLSFQINRLGGLSCSLRMLEY
jgi:hypothetical protein